MVFANLPLIIVLALGLAFGNRLVAVAASCLLVLAVFELPGAISLLEQRALDLGLILLTVAILVPLCGGRISAGEFTRRLFSLPGLFAVLGGIAATRLQGSGLILLRHSPEIVVGLLVGTIIGVCFLGGIPVGPLTAAGLTAILLSLLTLTR